MPPPGPSLSSMVFHCVLRENIQSAHRRHGKPSCPAFIRRPVRETVAPEGLGSSAYFSKYIYKRITGDRVVVRGSAPQWER